jgi:O-methyltransferase involved in polyketide biosynthesis
MPESSRTYFARRAVEEQERAVLADDPVAAEVHRKLQRVFVERASVGERDAPREVIG